MKICITTPLAETYHGGTRLILDMAEQLGFYNEVYLLSEKPTEKIFNSFRVIDKEAYHQMDFDLVILCSPHSTYVLDDLKGAQCIVFIQMLEHLWLNGKMAANCDRFYNSGHLTFVNAKFIQEHKKVGPSTVIDTWIPGYFRNLYNPSNKSTCTLLLESPETSNPTKDINKIALKVAARLKKYRPSLRIIGYGRNKPSAQYRGLFDSFVTYPSLPTLSSLYERATVLLKATMFDGRSCAPLEAMLFDCVNVRAIDYGDDHLNSENCYLSDYDEARAFELTQYALFEANNSSKIKKARELAESYTFSNFIKQIETPLNLKLYGA
jgi:hypothetical protein